MIFFGLMGLAALVVDLGFARLAEREMQTAVDAAALEGLRFRSDCPDDWHSDPAYGGPAPARPTTPYNESDPQWQSWLAWLDNARRLAAGRMVANVFDDDLDPANGDPRQFGAGPVIEFTGGVGPPELAASQLMVLPDPPVYKPVRSRRRSGAGNQWPQCEQGDMAAGTYGPNQAYDAAAGASSLVADEDAQYDRRDFSPATSVAAPYAAAFLAECGVPTTSRASMRMRGSVPAGRPCRCFSEEAL